MSCSGNILPRYDCIKSLSHNQWNDWWDIAGLVQPYEKINQRLKKTILWSRNSFEIPLPYNLSIMAGIKRKDAPTVKPSTSNSHKKLKTTAKGPKKPKQPAPELETATDSDPIVESDTTEHSGDNDGESWPSDDEIVAEKAISGYRKQTSKVDASAGSINGMSSCKFSLILNDSEANKPTATASKEAHAKQKAVAQGRKAAKPNADSIARSKKLWERLRRKSHVPIEERKELVAELFEIITGRVKDFVLKHDSVRVVQTALKYANRDQRKMIATELKGEYRGLAESKYAKFLIGKLLVHGDDEIRDMVIPELYGHVRRMIKHPEASWILDDIYRGAATPSQKAILLREWYGAEFAIFKTSGKVKVSAELKPLLAERPEKRTPILRSLHELINQLIQKKTTGFTMLHDAMLQYYLNVTPGSEEATEFIELLKGDEEGDLLKNLAFTKSGARLVCLALAYSSAKDRKQILKTYKNTIQTLAFDTHGHQVLLAAYDVIDDTVLTSKSIFPELFGKEAKVDEQHETILSYVTHLNARIPLLYPFTSKAKSIIPTDDLSILPEIHDIRSTTSKKDPELRRKELVRALSPTLLPFIAAKAEELIQTSFGCQFLGEVLLSAEGDKEEALFQVAHLAHIGQNSVEMQASIETPAASRMLKSLVLGGRFNPKTKAIDLVDPPLRFSNFLHSQVQDHLLSWATGSNAFVVVGLLESTDLDPKRKEGIMEDLRRHRGELEKATREVSTGDGESDKQVSAGRKGTQLILKMLDG